MTVTDSSKCITVLRNDVINATWEIRRFSTLTAQSGVYKESNAFQGPQTLVRDVASNWQVHPLLYFYTCNLFDSRHVLDFYSDESRGPQTCLGLKLKFRPLNDAPLSAPNRISVAVDVNGRRLATSDLAAKSDNVWTMRENKNATVENYVRIQRQLVAKDVVSLEFQVNQETPVHWADPSDEQETEDVATLWTLRQSGEYTDVQLELDDGTRLAAHKVVLALNSAVFKSLINETLNQTIQLTRMNETAAEDLLRFIYSGQLNESDVEQLLRAAHRFQVAKLKSRCHKLLIGRMSADSATRTLALANRLDDDFLKSATLQFVARNFERVTATGGWKEAVTRDPQTVDSVATFMLKLIEI